MRQIYSTSLLLLFAGVFSARGQETAKPAQPNTPDTLLFTNGEKLIGRLEASTGKSVTFKSDMAGTVTVDWSKVKELYASGTFVVIPKTAQVRKELAASDVRQGKIQVTDGNVTITPPAGGASQTVTVGDAGYVVTEADFHKATEGHPGFFRDWKGSASAGAALVEATQTSEAFTGSLALTRVEPDVNWLLPRNRTTVDFNAAYGKVTQPGTPDVKTDIYHADAERDEYFSKRMYGFGQLAFDHNFSQGLDLQQLYGGGIGITIFKRENQQLDGRAGLDYIRQSFTEASNNKNLIGSQFGENYVYKFPKGISFVEGLTVTPAWNNTNAWTALGSATVLFPAYKRLNVNLTAQDNYLNDPPAAFQKNSFQFTAGLTYAIQ